MIVDADGGSRSGTLGGGCVEAEVKQKAVRRIGEDGAKIESFVLDHDYAWADGLICGGKMVITTEALRGAGPLAYYTAYRRLLESGDGFTEAVVVEPSRLAAAIPTGARFVFGHDGRFVAGWPVSSAPEEVADRIAPLVDRPKAAMRGGVVVMPTLPRIRLVIVGAGHVGQAVGARASQAVFDVWVVGDRQQYANRRTVSRGRAAFSQSDRRGARHTRRHPQHIRPDRHPRPRTRSGGPLPPGADGRGLCRIDREHAQDQVDLRESAGGWDFRRRARASRCACGHRHRFTVGARDRREHRRGADRASEPRANRCGNEAGRDTVRQRPRAGAVGCDGAGMIAAVVPAAGHSQRMGRPKLILPIGGQTVIARVVSALRDGGASPGRRRFPSG